MSAREWSPYGSAGFEDWARREYVKLKGLPGTLRNLLKRPEWRGASVERNGEWLYVVKDNAVLQVRAEVLP